MSTTTKTGPVAPRPLTPADRISQGPDRCRDEQAVEFRGDVGLANRLIRWLGYRYQEHIAR